MSTSGHQTRAGSPRIWVAELPTKHGDAPLLLVGGIPTPSENMKVSWDDYSQYMEKNMFQTTNQVMLEYQRAIYEL